MQEPDHGAMPQASRLGVPLAGQRIFFGDRIAAAAYEAAIARMVAVVSPAGGVTTNETSCCSPATATWNFCEGGSAFHPSGTSSRTSPAAFATLPFTDTEESTRLLERLGTVRYGESLSSVPGV